MNIPTLPTDNLYKFMAISGLLIVIFFLSILIYSIFIIETKRLEIDNNIDITNTNIELTKKYLAIETKYLNDMLDLLNYKNEFTKIIPKDLNINKYIDDYKEFIKDRKEINEINYKIGLKLNENHSKVELEIQKNKNYVKELNKIVNFFIVLGIICFFGMLSGAYLAFKGFVLWKEKLQDHLDQNIKNITSN